MNVESDFLFYAYDGAPSLGELPSLAEGLRVNWWTPSVTGIKPAGFAAKPFAVWWALHHLRLFRNREYSLFGVYDGGQLVHRTCVFPGYARFPFMRADDLQLGDIWTAPNQRGRGLGAVGLSAAIHRFACEGRRLWYLVQLDNHASIRLAEKVGFTLHARGRRAPRWGIGALGYYEMTSGVPVTNPAARAA